MRRSLFKYSLLVLLIMFAFYLLQKIDILPSFKNFFVSQPVIIENTPIIVTEINTLAQLITVTYADEVVMDDAKAGKGIPSLITTGAGVMIVPATDKIVMIGRGKVVAGIDLKSLRKEDVSTLGDSIHLILPPAKILQTIINPSGFEIFDEKGEWDERAVTKLKVKIKDEITRRALQNDILKKSEDRGSNIIETFLKNTGYRKVKIAISR